MELKVFEHTDSELRFNSSSGGLFSLLADRILSEGGVVFGAAFDADWNVEHVGVDTREGVASLRKSKYMFSRMNRSVEDARECLESGRKVLFTGTPCNIALLKNKLGRDYPNLFTAEVVCHGAPQPESWNIYLDELLGRLKRQKSDIAGIDFRDKTTGWGNYSFTIRFKDGSSFSESHKRNLFMRLFVRDYIIKKGCFNCPFKYPGSKADITMGDLWGMKKLLPEKWNDSGTSVVAVNTAKGMELLSGVDFCGEVTLDGVAHYNPALVSAPVMPAKRGEFEEFIKKGGTLYDAGKIFLKEPLGRRLKYKLNGALRRIFNG